MTNQTWNPRFRDFRVPAHQPTPYHLTPGEAS
jgi:hypothetical protein